MRSVIAVQRRFHAAYEKNRTALSAPSIRKWTAVWEGGHFEPFFFDGNVNSDSYLEMLRRQFKPALMEASFADEAVFMQDGAPPHWGRQMHQCNGWTKGFPEVLFVVGHRTCRDGRLDRLTSCDFFLLGVVKSKVYTARPADLDDLKARILAAFGDVTVETQQKVMLAYKERLSAVMNSGGHHIEVI